MGQDGASPNYHLKLEVNGKVAFTPLTLLPWCIVYSASPSSTPSLELDAHGCLSSLAVGPGVLPVGITSLLAGAMPGENVCD